MATINYSLHLFGPSDHKDPVVFYDSETPFGSISVGDKMIPDFKEFEKFEKIPLEGFKVGGVKHQMFAQGEAIFHKISVYLL
ncbi:MAG TPA: hypothetical protein PKY05_00170 [Fibrobacteria bacterium]|nr:hypothetical protein [Fibrobacteria bacterium]